MKLVRIKSTVEDNTGFFSNEFKTPIKIEPNSKISLVNAVMNLDSKVIDVNNTNNTFSFQRKNAGQVSQVNIAVGKYSVQGFINLLKREMNKVIVVENTISFLWTPNVLTNGILKLNFARGNLQACDFPNANLVGCTKPTTKQIQSTSGGTDFFAFAISDNTFNPGCGIYRGEITASCENVIIGLMREKPTGITDYDHSIYDFGLIYKKNGDYETVVDGVYYTSSKNCLTTDLISIHLSEGKIKFLKNTTVIDEVDYDFNAPPLRIACSLSGANALLQNLQYHPNLDNKTFLGNNNPIVIRDYDEEVISNGLEAPPQTNLTLSLPEATKPLLGFEHTPEKTQLTIGSFIGDIPLEDSSTPLSVAIELPNLGVIESYDGYSRERRQIVGIIPQLNQSGSELVYEAPYPLPVNINNQFPISLSRIECRLLNSQNNEEINLEGEGCSLLFAIHN
ncbi:MAG: hypothetical protein P1U85_21230 [Verrucomicrobiales bacterium]|nr:hypothetical protein [Verrucomicrobiales bacterium]